MALVFGLSQTQGLVILFVVLPIVAAAILVPAMVWLFSRGPRPMLTSEILATGTPARGDILRIRTLGNVLDVRPMVEFTLRVSEVPGVDPFDLTVVQSIPRTMLGLFRNGDQVRVRLSPDRSAGAIEWGYETPDNGVDTTGTG